MDPTRVYIAGPFFNVAQIDLVRAVEGILDFYEVPYFSPRKMGLNSQPTTTKPTAAQAKEIFKKDYQEICNSTMVLAISDWLLPPGQRVILERPVGDPVLLNIPDAGTVWEMGCAYALRVPVVLFTSDVDRPMNLMLTQSCRGVIKGVGQLEEFFKVTPRDFDTLGSWTGEHR